MNRTRWLVLTLAVLVVAIFCTGCRNPVEPKMQCRQPPVGPPICKPACEWQAVAGIVRDNAGRDTQDTIPVWACWPNG